MGRSLWRKDGSVVYNCCWSSPAQSLSGPAPVGLATIFYCLKFETSLFVASYDSQGYGGGIRHRIHTGFWTIAPVVLLITFEHGPHKTPFIVVLQSFPREQICLPRRYSVTAAYSCLLRICCVVVDVVSRSLPSNGCTNYNIMSHKAISTAYLINPSHVMPTLEPFIFLRQNLNITWTPVPIFMKLGIYIL
jgi:hypothetical protein